MRLTAKNPQLIFREKQFFLFLNNIFKSIAKCKKRFQLNGYNDSSLSERNTFKTKKGGVPKKDVFLFDDPPWKHRQRPKTNQRTLDPPKNPFRPFYCL